jgi:hypothetical protein
MRRRAYAHRRRADYAEDRYFVLLDELLPLGLDEVVPLGLLVLDEPEPVAEGEVALEPEPVVVLLLPVVLDPGDADGGVVRSGVLPTRSVSVRLQATLTPASNASAQKPESIFFIADAPPCGVSNHEGGLQRTCPRRLT